MLIFNANTQQHEDVELQPNLDFQGNDTGELVAHFKDGSFLKFPRLAQKELEKLFKLHEDHNRKESNAIESAPIPVVDESTETTAEAPGGKQPVS